MYGRVLLAAIVVLCGPQVSSAETDGYDWAITSPTNTHVSVSGSSSSWSEFTLPPWSSTTTLYLWTVPFVRPSRGTQFAFDGTLEVLDLIPRPGVVNTGTVLAPILDYPDCLAWEVVAEIVVRDPAGAGGTLCFRPSDGAQINCSLQCDDLQYRSHYYHGFSSDGSDPCDGADTLDGCIPIPISVEPVTWGRTKSRYR